MRSMKAYLILAATLSVSPSVAFSPTHHSIVSLVRLSMTDGPAGSFFNRVPDRDDDDDDDDMAEEPKTPLSPDFDMQLSATIVGQTTTTGMGTVPIIKPYVALGTPDKPINDVTKPEYDKDGYTVYTNEKTGEKSRVFEALVEYPCQFTMKIVGANEGTFVQDVLQIVADSCHVEKETVSFSTREMGKWTSVTVQAPVANAEMLYLLYENIDKDPRVKFKF
jgi:putative lipoic acid-binding regulatory protein